jgi:DNA-binding MarR family transcriptional regulator
VDRRFNKGLGKRVESPGNRRVRTGSLTEKGPDMLVLVFRRQNALSKRAFQHLSPEELQQLEVLLKKIDKRGQLDHVAKCGR